MSEATRIAALRAYDLLDTPGEAAFDRLTALAADLFDAPSALIALIDDKRLWFKSRFGLDVAQTPRSEAICDHTIREPGSRIMVVEDASTDPRFLAYPNVARENGVRFYAGAKLVTPDGEAIGSLCIVDTKPRTRPPERMLRRLETLAQLVVDEFELRRLAREAAEKQALLEMAESIANVGSWRFEVETGRIVWSDEVYRIHGVSKETFDPALDDAIEFYHPDDRGAVADHLSMAVEQGIGFRFRLRLIRRDGVLRHVISKATVERLESGLVKSVIGVFQDVTDQVEAMQAVEISESRYRLLAEKSSDVIMRIGRDGLIRFVSPSARRYGVDPDQAVGQSALDLVSPDRREASHQILRQLVESGHVDPQVRRLHRRECPDGRIVWLEGSPSLVFDDEGQVIETVTVMRDVTSRVATEDALAASEARYRNLANTAPDIISESGVNGIVSYVSPASLTITGYRPDELVGNPFHAWIHPEDAPRVIETCREVLGSKGAVQPRKIEYRARHKDGHEIWLESMPTPVFDPASGRVTGFTDVARDITAHKQLEADLAKARAEAEAAAAVKSEFLANMSHELRTPLTAVIGFSKLLTERDDMSEGALVYAGRIDAAARALLSTVNDVLDFSKLEAGQVEIRPEPTAIDRLLGETVDLFSEMARAKGLAVRLAPVQLPALLVIDGDRVRQVLINLIGNAVKFTQSGVVEVRAQYGADGRLGVAIADTGPGIPVEKQVKLFQRFSQVDGGTTRRHGGAGLGLAICRGLIEAMGGTIGVESVAGSGSTFHFAVPAVTAQAPEISLVRSVDVASAGLKGLRMLLADDNMMNRNLVAAYVASLGISVIEAEDGAAAMAAAAEQPFDVILMDLRMPRVGGVEAAEAIRMAPGPNQDIPIIAFSADRFPVLPPGLFEGVLGKPVALPTLIGALNRVTAGEPLELQHAVG